MSLVRQLGLLTLGLLVLPGRATAWPVRDAAGQPTGAVIDSAEMLRPGALPAGAVLTPPADLAAVAAGTLAYLQAQTQAQAQVQAQGSNDPAVSAGIFADQGVDLDRVMAGLDFVVRVAAEDRGQAHQRLQDPAFLAAHFSCTAWRPDLTAAAERGLSLPPDQIRLTRYLVPQIQGRLTPDAPYVHALYAPPVDLPPQTYTRQQVMAGVFEPGGAAAGQAAPLVYLRAQDVYDALMQGTVQVLLPNGSRRTYNVAVNNGHAYQPNQRDAAAQPRYWYFAQVDDIQGWAHIPLRPGAAVAGDITNLGLGKLVALESTGPDGRPALRLVVLADTGGAFQPNLFQLDYLAGSFPDRTSFQAATADLPATTRACFLLLSDD